MLLKSLPEDKTLTIETVSQNRLNNIKKHDFLRIILVLES